MLPRKVRGLGEEHAIQYAVDRDFAYLSITRFSGGQNSEAVHLNKRAILDLYDVLIDIVKEMAKGKEEANAK